MEAGLGRIFHRFWTNQIRSRVPLDLLGGGFEFDRFRPFLIPISQEVGTRSGVEKRQVTLPGISDVFGLLLVWAFGFVLFRPQTVHFLHDVDLRLAKLTISAAMAKFAATPGPKKQAIPKEFYEGH